MPRNDLFLSKFHGFQAMSLHHYNQVDVLTR
jgi:hypothetical protein